MQPTYVGIPVTDTPHPTHDEAVDDLTELMEVLGIPTHARPISPHEVFQGKVLPTIRTLVDENKRLQAPPGWKAQRDRAEYAEGQVVKMTQKLEEVRATVARLQEKLDKVRELRDDLGGAFPQGLSDDMSRIYLDLAAILDDGDAAVLRQRQAIAEVNAILDES